MQIVHDTASSPPSRQFTFYHEVLCANLTSLRTGRDGAGPCRAQTSFESFGGVVVIHTGLPRRPVVRSRQEMARPAPGTVFIHMVRGGGVDHDHRGVDDHAGHILMSDPAGELQAAVPDRPETTTLAIPRAEMAARAPGFEQQVGVARSMARGAPAMLAAFTRALEQHGPELEADDRIAAGAQLCDMAARVFRVRDQPSTVSLTQARRVALLDHIRAHVFDSDLSAVTVAGHFGLSRRYVDKLFADADESFGEVVLRKRLEAAAALLQAPERTGQTITSIAFDCGFADLTTFNRRFKRAYDRTPRDYRAEALRSVPPRTRSEQAPPTAARTP